MLYDRNCRCSSWRVGQQKLVLLSITLLLTIQTFGINVFGAKTIAWNNAITTTLAERILLSSDARGQDEQQVLLSSLSLSTHPNKSSTLAQTYDEADANDDDDNNLNGIVIAESSHYAAGVEREIHQKAQLRHKPSRTRINNARVENELKANRNEFTSNKQSHAAGVVNSVTHHTTPTRSRRSVFHVRWNPNEKYIVESREKPAVNNSKLSPHPRWALSKNTKLTLNPKLYVCHDPSSERCHNKTTNFRNYIVQTFEKSLSEAANESNFYNVDFKPLFGDSFEEQYYPSTCLVMEAGVRVLKRRDAPFNRLEFGKLFPKQKLFRHLKSIKTCVIVSSAGSMAGAKLGRFIDSHDIVMRFNDAPTLGYEVDVGSKTTIRVVNSQVVTKAEFDFTHAPIFQNVTIAAWDPGKYNDTLGDWLTNADYDLFTNYEIYRRRYPKSRAFLIHPHSIWRLWQSLQMFAGNRPIRKNPPSSGFIGLALLLPHCPYVDFIEYMPSTRLNGRCHYYSKEMNSACTFGAWHPLAAEKLMALDMNVGDDFSVFQFGLLRIRRPNKLLCGFNFLGY